MDVAPLIGTGITQICEWEAGRRRPNLAHAVRLEVLSEGAIPYEAWGHPPSFHHDAAKLVALRGETKPTASSALWSDE